MLKSIRPVGSIPGEPPTTRANAGARPLEAKPGAKPGAANGRLLRSQRTQTLTELGRQRRGLQPRAKSPQKNEEQPGALDETP